MRILFIAILVFFLQVSIGLVDVLGIYDYNIATQNNWLEETISIENQAYLRSDVTADVSTTFGFGDFIVGMNILIKTVKRVLWLPDTLKLFGLDAVLAVLFSGGVFLLYGLGLAQFISNRGTKGMR